MFFLCGFFNNNIFGFTTIGAEAGEVVARSKQRCWKPGMHQASAAQTTAASVLNYTATPFSRARRWQKGLGSLLAFASVRAIGHAKRALFPSVSSSLPCDNHLTATFLLRVDVLARH